MFCENCGKQLPDGSAFCDNCGAQLAPVAPVQPAAPVAVARPPMPSGQKKRLGLIAAGLAAIVIAVVVIVNAVNNTVNLKNYLTITAEGYDGYASLDYEIDYYALFEKVTGQDISGIEDIYDLEMLSNSSSIIAKAEALDEGLDVEITYPDGKTSDRLANGDVVTFTVTFEKDAAKALGKKFKEATVEYVVEGLTQAAVYDVLSHFDVTFSGCEGEGYSRLAPVESTETVGGIQCNVYEDNTCVHFYISETDDDVYYYVDLTGLSGGLSNGDTVTATFPLESDYFAEYGVILDGLTKEFEVSGLGKYVSTLSEISADALDTLSARYMEDLKNRLYDNWSSVVHGSSWRSYTEQSIGSDLKLYRTVLTTPKKTDSFGNTLWLVYSVTLDDNAIEKPTVYYFYYEVHDVIVNADGAVDTELEYDAYGSTGYTDYNVLYDNEIDSYSRNIEISE